MLASSMFAGCARGPYIANEEAQSATAKMTAQPAPSAAPGRRVSSLLDFESPQDLVFIATEPPAAAALDTASAHGGSSCLLLPPGTNSLIIKTPTLLQGRPFPADWTLLGAYVLVDRPTYITASFESAGQPLITRTVGVAPGAWTPVMIDLAALGSATRGEAGTFRLRFTAGSTVRLDDVMLVDNHEVLIDTSAVSSAGWRVQRKGLYYIVEAPGRFSFAVSTSQAQAGGWVAVEASEARARFMSTAPPGSMTIYPDGRMYWGGQFRSAWRDLHDAKEQALQHTTPAEIGIPDSMGRVNRSTPGDGDNDGYNEARGAYQIVASGSRIELALSPRTAVLSRPVLEIAGLPAGTVRVTMEGRLVPGALRLPSGDVLIELPGPIARPTLINVRAQ